ncbi:hypothetical protein BJY04DRAFT_195797 [Aspergillus karnatakaensis]|uniref:uncharacterized protein n=1 Tax=Aspergillus karnatakaensis TaxID=1810916 RepID=UPI003CCD5052
MESRPSLSPSSHYEASKMHQHIHQPVERNIPVVKNSAAMLSSVQASQSTGLYRRESGDPTTTTTEGPKSPLASTRAAIVRERECARTRSTQRQAYQAKRPDAVHGT